MSAGGSDKLELGMVAGAPGLLPLAGNSGVTVTWPAFALLAKFTEFAVPAGMPCICAPAGAAGNSKHPPRTIPSAKVSWVECLGLKRQRAVKHSKVIQYRNK